MGDLVIWNGVTKLDIPVERILDRAREENLDSAIVLGWDKDGGVFFASSVADGGNVMWLMEWAKRALLDAMTNNTTTPMIG